MIKFINNAESEIQKTMTVGELEGISSAHGKTTFYGTISAVTGYFLVFWGGVVCLSDPIYFFPFIEFVNEPVKIKRLCDLSMREVE